MFPVTTEVRLLDPGDARQDATDDRQAAGTRSPVGTSCAIRRTSCSTVRVFMPWPTMCRRHWTNTSNAGCASVQRLSWAVSTNRGGTSATSQFISFVLEEVCALRREPRAVGNGVARSPARTGRRAVTGETVKPRHLWTGPAWRFSTRLHRRRQTDRNRPRPPYRQPGPGLAPGGERAPRAGHQRSTMAVGVCGSSTTTPRVSGTRNCGSRKASLPLR